MYIEKPDYPSYVKKLEEVSGIEIKDFSSLMEALSIRMDYFASRGCCVSDHGLAYVPFAPAKKENIERIFEKRMEGEIPTEEEQVQFTTAFMTAVGKEYYKRDWVMQIHYGVKRDNDKHRAKLLGADTGFDCIANQSSSAQFADFLDGLAVTNELPKTILYSLDPNDNAAIGTIIGCFQELHRRFIGKSQNFRVSGTLS